MLLRDLLSDLCNTFKMFRPSPFCKCRCLHTYDLAATHQVIFGPVKG